MLQWFQINFILLDFGTIMVLSPLRIPVPGIMCFVIFLPNYRFQGLQKYYFCRIRWLVSRFHNAEAVFLIDLHTFPNTVYLFFFPLIFFFRPILFLSLVLLALPFICFRLKVTVSRCVNCNPARGLSFLNKRCQFWLSMDNILAILLLQMFIAGRIWGHKISRSVFCMQLDILAGWFLFKVHVFQALFSKQLLKYLLLVRDIIFVWCG